MACSNDLQKVKYISVGHGSLEIEQAVKMIQISIKDGDIFPITKAKDLLRSKVASELIKDAAFNIKYFQLDDGQDPQE